MKVLVDTSIWSKALRRSAGQNPIERQTLADLIASQRALIMGPIRQEILSGIKEERQFEELKDRLIPFPDVPLLTEDFVTAAKFFNLCRAKGIQGSNTDFLICAVAVNNRLSIFTADEDFAHFQKVLPISLFEQ
jgi:predicted nucleic acid-binding protein